MPTGWNVGMQPAAAHQRRVLIMVWPSSAMMSVYPSSSYRSVPCKYLHNSWTSYGDHENFCLLRLTISCEVHSSKFGATSKLRWLRIWWACAQQVQTSREVSYLQMSTGIWSWQTQRKAELTALDRQKFTLHSCSVGKILVLEQKAMALMVVGDPNKSGVLWYILVCQVVSCKSESVVDSCLDYPFIELAVLYSLQFMNSEHDFCLIYVVVVVVLGRCKISWWVWNYYFVHVCDCSLRSWFGSCMLSRLGHLESE